MEARYRLDIGKKEKKDSFIFDLNDLEGKELELSIEYIAHLSEKAIKEKNFQYGYDLIKMAQKLRDYDNSFLFHIEAMLRIEECFSIIKSNKSKKIIDLYKIKEKTHSTINFARGNFDVQIRAELTEKIKELIKLNNEISLESSLDILEESMKKNSIKIKEASILNEVLENSEKYKVEKNKIENLLIIYMKKLKEHIATLKNNKARINKLKSLFEEFREEDFLNSKEFLNILKEEKAFNSYEDLIEIERKSYLLYRFNNTKNLKDEITILCKLNIKNYNSLPNVYKECAAIRLKKNYNKTLELKWLYEFMDEIISSILENNSRKVILIP